MNKNQKDWIDITSGVNVRKCMRCGKCSATCPSYDEMEYHPHQFDYAGGAKHPVLFWKPHQRCHSARH